MRGGIIYTMGRNNKGQRGLGKDCFQIIQIQYEHYFVVGYCNNVHEPTVVCYLQHLYIQVINNVPYKLNPLGFNFKII